MSLDFLFEEIERLFGNQKQKIITKNSRINVESKGENTV